jgi:glucose/arabinose dehydrogenase
MKVPKVKYCLQLILPIVILMGYTSHSQSLKSSDANIPQVKIDTVFSGFQVPWGVAFLPNGSALVIERFGGLKIIEPDQSKARVVAGLPEVSFPMAGLLDIELHPNYKENGWIYISYVAKKEGKESGNGVTSALLRGKLVGYRLVDVQYLFKALPNVEFNPHLTGRIVFDKNGDLLFSVGDRMFGTTSQDLGSHLGKVMRIREDGTIPTSNPFVGKQGAKGEIYVFGLRNPQGLAVHPRTGEIWEHEHGPQGGDEINILEAGRNYGWPAITYGIGYDSSIISTFTALPGMEQPIKYWNPSIAPCALAIIPAENNIVGRDLLLISSLRNQEIRCIEVDGHTIVKEYVICDKIGRVRKMVVRLDRKAIYLVEETTGKILILRPGFLKDV